MLLLLLNPSYFVTYTGACASFTWAHILKFIYTVDSVSHKLKLSQSV